jgi:hypothetical protein
VRYGLMEVGIDLDEHSAVLDGPDVLRVRHSLLADRSAR